MFALWFILAVSVLCESVAQQWQVWVSARLFEALAPTKSASLLGSCSRVLVWDRSNLSPRRTFLRSLLSGSEECY